ncbi:hypothetical protein ABE042_08170 [Viridibacillus arvi]|uniref:hypothetical protein n=1 Tax=Viridibacillus arvi TaxID=263475 RepID=UPI003CFD7563
MNLKGDISTFFRFLEVGVFETENEFSLQHELGIFLRTMIESPYKLQFGRSVNFFYPNEKGQKSEIDIVIYNPATEERYGIELNFPNKGQHVEQMFHLIKDIKFMEEVKKLGFTKTYAVTYVEDALYYRGSKTDGIYAYFRSNKPIHGVIQKHGGKKEESLQIENTYKVRWNSLGNGGKYYIVET